MQIQGHRVSSSEHLPKVEFLSFGGFQPCFERLKDKLKSMYQKNVALIASNCAIVALLLGSVGGCSKTTRYALARRSIVSCHAKSGCGTDITIIRKEMGRERRRGWNQNGRGPRSGEHPKFASSIIRRARSCFRHLAERSN